MRTSTGRGLTGDIELNAPALAALYAEHAFEPADGLGAALVDVHSHVGRRLDLNPGAALAEAAHDEVRLEDADVAATEHLKAEAHVGAG